MFDYLYELEMDKLVDLLILAEDYSEGHNEELLEIYNVDSLYLYGFRINHLDNAQLDYMSKNIGDVILQKLMNQHNTI